jgi:hypothetical protein
VRRLPPADGKSWRFGPIAITGGQPGSVYVIAHVDSRAELDATLDGWADVCGQLDSLEWARERLAALTGTRI